MPLWYLGPRIREALRRLPSGWGAEQDEIWSLDDTAGPEPEAVPSRLEDLAGATSEPARRLVLESLRYVLRRRFQAGAVDEWLAMDGKARCRGILT